jgi:hypothetical protein
MKNISPQYFDYLNVPLELCAYSLKHNKTKQVGLYLYFKSISRGHINNCKEVYSDAARYFELCGRTIKNHTLWLINEGWLIPFPNLNSIRVIGFRQLAEKLNFISASGVLIYKAELKDYKSAAIAAIIKYSILRMKRKKPLTELKKGSSQSCRFLPYPHLPHAYLAKVLNKSKTTSAIYRKLAKEKKFLKSKKRFQDLNLPSVNLNHFKEFGPYESEKLKKIGNRINEQLPDEIICNITLRRKNNLRAIVKKNWMGKKRYR